MSTQAKLLNPNNRYRTLKETLSCDALNQAPNTSEGEVFLALAKEFGLS